jgi:hypothetical protein
MDALAERVSGWWVARVSQRSITKFSASLPEEHYSPLQTTRSKDGQLRKAAVIPYVFIRAEGRSIAWQLAGFQRWVLTGQHRAIVEDRELDEFRRIIQAMCDERKEQLCRRGVTLLRKFSGNQDYTETLH